MWFGQALAGMSPWVIKLYLGFMLLKRLKMFEMFMSLTIGLRGSFIASQQLALQQHMLLSKIVATDAGLKKQALTLKWQAMEAERTATAYKALASAVMGVGFGIYMMATGMTRQAKIMGAVITTIMAVTFAYNMMAAAAAAATPWSAPARIAAWGAVAALGIGSMAYAATADIPEPETPNFDFAMPELPKAQGGMRLVGGNGPQAIIAHPGEQISSANKEAPGVGTVIEIHDSMFFDWDGFVARMNEELGAVNIKEIRRYR